MPFHGNITTLDADQFALFLIAVIVEQRVAIYSALACLVHKLGSLHYLYLAFWLTLFVKHVYDIDSTTLSRRWDCFASIWTRWYGKLGSHQISRNKFVVERRGNFVIVQRRNRKTSCTWNRTSGKTCFTIFVFMFSVMYSLRERHNSLKTSGAQYCNTLSDALFSYNDMQQPLGR